MEKKLISLVVTFLLAIPAIASANLLNNSDFETGTLGQFGSAAITDWTTWGTNGWYHSDYNHTPSASRAVKTWWDDTGIYQDFAAASTTSYAIGGYAYTPSSDTLGSGWDGVLKVEWFSGATKINEVEIGRFDADVDPADTWKQISSTVIAPAGIDTGRVVMNLVSDGSGNTSGALGWDDMSAELVPIPEPTSLILLGSGLVGMFVAARKKRQNRFEIK